MNLLAVYIFSFMPIMLITVLLQSDKILKRLFTKRMTLSIVFLAILPILLLRDISAPADINNYLHMYNSAINYEYIFNAYHGNVFFSFLMYIGQLLNLEWEVFFYSLSILSLLIYTKGIQLIFKNEKYYILALVFFSFSSTFVLLYTNIIRQGLSTSLLVLTIGLILNKNVYLAFLTTILSIFSHFSVIPIIIMMMISKFIFKHIKYKYFILILIFLPIMGSIALTYLNSLGGLFSKIHAMQEHNYTNNLVYIKIIILYICLIVYYVYGKKYLLFQNINYKFVFNIYLLILSIILFTSPILLLSSRFLYYDAALMPILFSFIFYSRYNIFQNNIKYFLTFILALIYGYIVYSFASVQVQLGII